MKNIFFLAGLFLMTLSGCEMLDENPRSNIDKSDYVKDASQAESVLLGVYRGLSLEGTYGNNLSMLYDLTTDEAQCEGNSNVNFRAIPSGGFNSSHAEIERTWKELYASIYNATDFIEIATRNMENFSEEDRKLTEYYIAEAKVLRALFYFDLVRWFGHIVLVETTDESYLPNEGYEQAAPEKVYEFIEKDLLEAARVLPWASDDLLRKDTAYRLSRGSAYGLLMKVYATWAGYPVHDTGKWAEVVKIGEIMTSSERHSLLPDFEQLWKDAGAAVWNPQEVLIAASFFNLTSGTPAGRIGKFNGVKADAIAGTRGSNGGYVKVLYPFIADWSTKNDPRFDISVASFNYKGTIKTAYSQKPIEDSASDIKNWQLCTPGKWDTEKYVPKSNLLIDANFSNISWYILRYADVLLLYAEAINETKKVPDATAYEMVNMVRRRGYGKDIHTADSSVDLPQGMGYEEFLAAIKQERSYELCFEGHRKQDLIRWGEYYETVCATSQKLFALEGDANYVIMQYIQKGKNELMPIPLREIDLMGLRQNDNW